MTDILSPDFEGWINEQPRINP